MEFIPNAATHAHQRELRDLRARVQLETGMVDPYVAIVSLDLTGGKSSVLRGRFLEFLRTIKKDANLLILRGHTLKLGNMPVNGVFYQGDITEKLRVNNGALVIPPESVLIGSEAIDDTLKQVHGYGSQSYGAGCNSLNLFCPEPDYPARNEMREFLTAYYSMFGKR
jgi:hypothetical protein